MQRFRRSGHRSDVGADERSDADLLAGLRLQPQLMGVLYERHAVAVYRFLARRAGHAVAEDLLSEVFVAALGARKRVLPHESGSALPWLYGIAGNVVRSHLRRLGRQTSERRGETMDWDAVDARLDAQAHRSLLRAVLSELSAVEREVLLLVGWEGLTPAEAAAALRISATSARSRLHRARARAQRALDDATARKEELGDAAPARPVMPSGDST
jgi:RNA polymerase sigma factor (sigma-70 family)